MLPRYLLVPKLKISIALVLPQRVALSVNLKMPVVQVHMRHTVQAVDILSKRSAVTKKSFLARLPRSRLKSPDACISSAGTQRVCEFICTVHYLLLFVDLKFR